MLMLPPLFFSRRCLFFLRRAGATPSPLLFRAMRATRATLCRRERCHVVLFALDMFHCRHYAAYVIYAIDGDTVAVGCQPDAIFRAYIHICLFAFCHFIVSLFQRRLLLIRRRQRRYATLEAMLFDFLRFHGDAVGRIQRCRYAMLMPRDSAATQRLLCSARHDDFTPVALYATPFFTNTLIIV